MDGRVGVEEVESWVTPGQVSWPATWAHWALVTPVHPLVGMSAPTLASAFLTLPRQNSYMT